MALLKVLAVAGMLLSLTASVQAQSADSTERQLLKELEMLLEEADETGSSETEQLTQLLQDLAANPVDINRADAEALMQIPGVTLRRATAIIRYRAKNGPFQSTGALVTAGLLKPDDWERMRPFITVRQGAGAAAARTAARLMRNPEGEAMFRFRTILEDQDGYGQPDSVAGRYLGPQGAHYQRLSFSTAHLSLNLTQETDPGEPGRQPVSTDFRSMHAAVRDAGPFKTLVAGDFTAGFGQGLVLFNGGAVRKGREVIGAAGRGERGIVPYRSAEESRFFRGAGFETKGRISLAGFYSSRRWSASPAGDTAVFFPSFSGLNRTENERARRNNLGVQTAAARLRFKGDLFQAGVSGYDAQFDRTVTDRASQGPPGFEGRRHQAFSADVQAAWGGVQFFGELACSREQARALITGAEWTADDATTLIAVYRRYDRQYLSLFGDALSEGSGPPQNEEGLYTGIRHRVNRTWSLAAYSDQYRFPGPTASLSRASTGADYLFTADAALRDGSTAYVLLRTESRDAETEGTDAFGRIVTRFGTTRRSSIRLHAEVPVSKEIRWRSRLEHVYAASPGSPAGRGLLFYQDLRWRAAPSLQLDARISWFDAGSFDARVYQFENDLLFVMSNTALSGRGRRFYLLAKWEPYRATEIWAKYDATLYDDRTEVGSGADRVAGPVRSRFGIQMRVRF